MEAHKVCKLEELMPGARKIIEVKGRSIGVFNVKGNLTAVKNLCPHQGAPLCKGNIGSMTISDENRNLQVIREGEILRCPWHGWEFDLMNGKSISDPLYCRTKHYEVAVQEDPVKTYDISIISEYVYVYV